MSRTIARGRNIGDSIESSSLASGERTLKVKAPRACVRKYFCIPLTEISKVALYQMHAFDILYIGTQFHKKKPNTIHAVRRSSVLALFAKS